MIAPHSCSRSQKFSLKNQYRTKFCTLHIPSITVFLNTFFCFNVNFSGETPASKFRQGYSSSLIQAETSYLSIYADVGGIRKRDPHAAAIILNF